MDMEEDKGAMLGKSDYDGLDVLLKVHMLETYPCICISIFWRWALGISQGSEGGAP